MKNKNQKTVKPIFTIEFFENQNGQTTYYFDLLSNLKFGVSVNEKIVFTSKEPNECIKYLKKRGCVVSENYNYTYLTNTKKTTN
jgi:hypothetical protein